MRLLELTCDHFRCLEQLRFVPGPGLNVIQGDNAQGKTSILEALLYAATAKSHRTNVESDLAQRGHAGFRVVARAARRDRDVVVETAWARGAKRVRVNGVHQTRVSDVLGHINVVLFSPEDADLIRGAASNRRTFMDMELSQLSPHYLRALQRYRHVMRQRNEVLRRAASDESMLDVWDAQLVEQGKELIEARAAFVKQLAPLAADAYSAVAGGESLAMAYEPDVPEPEQLHEVLAATRKSDLRQGMTTRGPHRDDIAFYVDEKPARQFASQGQQKTAGLAVKLAELALIRERTGEYPILMLDDVFAELDAPRSRRVLMAVPKETQCLITTTELALHEDVIAREPTLFRVRGGRLSAE